MAEGSFIVETMRVLGMKECTEQAEFPLLELSLINCWRRILQAGVPLEHLERDFHWGGHLAEQHWARLMRSNNLVAMDGGLAEHACACACIMLKWMCMHHAQVDAQLCLTSAVNMPQGMTCLINVIHAFWFMLPSQAASDTSALLVWCWTQAWSCPVMWW